MEQLRKASSGGARIPWWGPAGLAIFGVGVWTLAADIELANSIWYVPAWYGYLLLLDAGIFRLRGASPLQNRPREVAALLVWSVPFWLLFEAYNLRLENWYYVFAQRSRSISVLLGAVAFATVLPACFFHVELVKAFGWWRETRCRRLRVSRAVKSYLLVLGVVSIIAPLLWPRYAFWMVWGATLWLPDLVNYHVGAPSLLRHLESGRCGRLLELLTGGLWAGVAWETFNFWARCKWIYTVPGFEEAKIFEMPFLGFFGFPVLALAAFAFYSLIGHFVRGGRHWMETSHPPQAISIRRPALVLLAAAALSWLAFEAMVEKTVGSLRPVLSELTAIDGQAAAALRASGIPTPERLYRAVRRDGLEAVSTRSGIAAERVKQAFEHASLALHKGMGTSYARLLRTEGIGSVRELAFADARSLWLRLRRAAEEIGVEAPRPAEVKVWIRAARVSGEARR